MDVSSLSSATTDAYLQYLTDGKSGNKQSSLFSSTDSTTITSVDTTYLDKAAAGTTLTASEQKAAIAELKDVLVGHLFDISA